MRVIAGKWRGRVLRSPRGEAVRPTADRVKEALFSMLAPDLPGALFVDLCCGAGGLALEALSRGADQALLIDTSGRSLEVARTNLELCGAEAGTYQLVRADCLRWLDGWIPPGSPWLVVADPPYDSPLPWAILTRLAQLADTPGFRVAVVEHRSAGDSTQLPELPPGLDLSLRRYGQSSLAIVRPR